MNKSDGIKNSKYRKVYKEVEVPDSYLCYSEQEGICCEYFNTDYHYCKLDAEFCPIKSYNSFLKPGRCVSLKWVDDK